MANLTPEERWKLWAARSAERREQIKSSIRRRWALPKWDIDHPWWRDPARVRILMYAEGNINFTEHLMYVHTLLSCRPFFQVDFQVETAHRNFPNAGTTIPSPIQLTDPKLDLVKNFEEVWMFGLNTAEDLTAEELALLKTFMKEPTHGGILVTGDHEDRGKSIAGGIIRAGKMRAYPSPGISRPDWNNSLRDGPDQGSTYDPLDQSDDVAQTIRPELFPIVSLPGFKIFHRPHPVLCGIEGTIDVLPDHQHEGRALAPAVDPTDPEWPKKHGHQERPLIIAHGTTQEPQTGVREFEILSAYDGHNVDVGRIVADASWHHWFNDNLLGDPGSDVYRGFDDSPEGRKVLKKIDNYFLNCGGWLAPPAKQREMRLAAWWSILWTIDIAELSPDMPLWDLGEQALAALRRHASVCTASDWVFGDLKQKLSRGELKKISGRLPALNVTLEQLLAGGILKSLMTTVGPSAPGIELPFQAPSDQVLDNAINLGIEAALSSIR